MYNVFLKHKFLVYFSVLIILGAFSIFIYSLSVHASVYNLYSTSCLGGWKNTHLATGAPEASISQISTFSESNSALLEDNTQTQIFCGGFSGDIIEGTIPQKILVKFSWAAMYPDQDNLEEENNEDTIDTGEETIEEDSEEDTEDSTEEDSLENTDETTEEEITGEEESIEDETEVTPSEETSEPAEPTEPVLPEEPTISPEPVAFFYNLFGKFVFAQEVSELTETTPTEQIEEDTESTEETTEEITNTEEEVAEEETTTEENSEETTEEDSLENTDETTEEEIIGEEEIVEDDFVEGGEIIEDDEETESDILNPEVSYGLVEVLYTLNGVDWKSLGFVKENEFGSKDFEIPIEEASQWEDISKIQIGIKSLPILDDVLPVIFLDSVWLEAEYKYEEQEFIEIIDEIFEEEVVEDEIIEEENEGPVLGEGAGESQSLPEFISKENMGEIFTERAVQNITLNRFATHSCKAVNFNISLEEEDEVFETFELTGSSKLGGKLIIGSLPKGIDARFVENNSYELKTTSLTKSAKVKFTRGRGAQKGSFNVSLIYQLNPLMPSNVLCQVNVINTK